MNQSKSPGSVYVGLMLFATVGLVDDLIDRVRLAEDGAHRAARTLLGGGDCPDEECVQASPHTVVELRAGIADLSSRIDAVAGQAASGNPVRSAT